MIHKCGWVFSVCLPFSYRSLHAIWHQRLSLRCLAKTVVVECVSDYAGVCVCCFADSAWTFQAKTRRHTSWVEQACFQTLPSLTTWPPSNLFFSVSVYLCVCALYVYVVVQTPLERFKQKRGDNYLGWVEQACFHRLPLLISNELCYSCGSDRWCYSSQLTSLCACLRVCACNVRIVACVHQHVNKRTSPRKLHASSSTCRTRAKGTSDSRRFEKM